MLRKSNSCGALTGAVRTFVLMSTIVLLLASPAGVVAQEEARDEVVQAFYDLVDRDPFVQRPAALFLQERGDFDALPFMVVTLRYEPFRNETLVRVLGEMSGEDFGASFGPWSEWLVRRDIAPHPAYKQWKADLLARLDPGFGEFLDPAWESTIDYREINWGGVSPEGIPSLDDPMVIAAADADYLTGEEFVFGVALSADGSEAVEARAYPLRILDWHEMTNDTVGGVPVALSYCTLCGSAVLFDRRLGEYTFAFATSGLLYRSNKLMFDRQTRTLWSNLTGKPVLGTLVGENLQLDVLPVVVTTWDDWRATYPDTTVLSPETGYRRDYSPGAAYGSYFASDDLMFPVAQRDARLAPKAWVFGLRVDDTAVAFELESLQERRILNTVVGGEPVVLISGRGRAVRAYVRDDRQFGVQPNDEGMAFLVDGDGGRWRISDIGLHPEAGGGMLRRLPGHLAYWFGWYAFFPDTDLWPDEGR